MVIQQEGSHLVLQVILPVHLVIRDVKVVIGVIVLEHAAGGGRQGRQKNPSPSYPTVLIFHIQRLVIFFLDTQKILIQKQQVGTYNSLIPYGPTR